MAIWIGICRKRHGGIKMRYKVYIAGKITDLGNDMLKNMHNFYVMYNELAKLGFSPFNPANDYIYGIMYGDYDYDDYFDPNIEWLKVSDAMLVLPNWENSEGTKREIEIARKCKIPVFFDVPSLLRWRER